MNPSSQNFYTLIDRVLDGLYTDEDARRLNNLLRSDAEACRLYVEYAKLHGQLAWRGIPQTAPQQPDAEPCVPLVVPTPNVQHAPFVGSPLFACMVATVVLAVMLLGAWLYKISIPEPPAVEQSHSIATLDVPLPAIVGRVTGLHECRRADADTETFLGAPVRIDSKYSLDAGLLEITYSTGARVILEGPCEYVIDSRASGYLGVGKLIARVEAGGGESGNRGVGESGNRENRSGDSTFSAPLFAIRTPSAVVTDLGTEFGVIVGEDGDTATHVIEGRVELKVLGDDRPEHQAIRIAAGESVHVERPAKDKKDDLAAVARGKANTNLFTVHPGKLTEYVAEKRLEPFRRWQAFSDELLKRDDLVDYWDFQRDRKNPLVLRNRAPGGHDGTIEGARWVPGRFPGKHALRFSYPSHRVRVRLNDKINGSRQLTLVAWVRVDVMQAELSTLMIPDSSMSESMPNDPIYFQWGIWKKGYPYFGLVNQEGIGLPQEMPGKLPSFISTAVDMCVAVMLDDFAKKYAFYCDGKVAFCYDGKGKVEWNTFFGDRISLGAHDYLIGNYNVPAEEAFADVDHSYRGSIGELMIFNKALSPDEIGRIYKEGTATPSAKMDSAIDEQP